MNDQQRKEVLGAPKSYQGIMERAYTGNSRTTAIKATCLRCVGYVKADIRGCTALACPLWTFRPYVDGDESVDSLADPQETEALAV